ncbi:transcriptional regulator [Pararhizobium polonicum]|uniref:Transcriptional regulator n=1 Tax=Pararhizobium polonicum TaxID=1612624 RepID=A0A1C7P638_9HYPH|nr:AlpA family phage regulatory protein [Pararhizobium polonicum]OBZ96742.1 transcriptional regulator [Pararhizobium polonicum]
MCLISAEGLKVKGIDFSKTQLWRLTKAGRFPRPVAIGFKRRAWVEAEVDAWIMERIEERDAH